MLDFDDDTLRQLKNTREMKMIVEDAETGAKKTYLVSVKRKPIEIVEPKKVDKYSHVRLESFVVTDLD